MNKAEQLVSDNHTMLKFSCLFPTGANHHRENRRWCELHRTVTAGAALLWLPFPSPRGGPGLEDAGSGALPDGSALGGRRCPPERRAGARESRLPREELEERSLPLLTWEVTRGQTQSSQRLRAQQPCREPPKLKPRQGFPCSTNFKVVGGSPRGAA